MASNENIENFINEWRATGGSELANTQSFINGLCSLLGLAPPAGSRTDDSLNDYVFERRVFQDNGDGTISFGRIDCYKKNHFVLEANFLYVSMAKMKELEGEVVDLLVELGDKQYVAELTGHTITPENFLGLEINPRAAAIAQLVLWIGYLQWHFRVNGVGRAPPEPILRDVKTIENRDALIDFDDKVQQFDENGVPIMRWDGETVKLHPVTKRDVPDESAKVEVYKYINPRRAKWPKADFIVGNPPFIGVRRINERLGVDYVNAVRNAYSHLIPPAIDPLCF